MHILFFELRLKIAGIFWKYKKDFLLKKYQRNFNVTVKSFHFLNYKEFLFFGLGSKSLPDNCIMYYWQLHSLYHITLVKSRFLHDFSFNLENTYYTFMLFCNNNSKLMQISHLASVSPGKSHFVIAVTLCNTWWTL